MSHFYFSRSLIVTFVMASVVQLTTDIKHHILNTNSKHFELFDYENNDIIEETLDLLFDSDNSLNLEYDLKRNILNRIKFPDYNTEEDTTSDFESDESFDTEFVLSNLCGRKRKLCEMESQKKTSEKSLTGTFHSKFV